MVVSVDISGILEERLRKLVELGIYASISEAVRDALRRLMDQIDLVYVGIQLYRRSNATLAYVCEFSGAPCNRIVARLLEEGIIPLLGRVRRPENPSPPPERLLIAPTALYTIYNSYLNSLLEVVSGRTQLLIARGLEGKARLWEARGAYYGYVKQLLEIDVLEECARTRLPKDLPPMSRDEQATYGVARSCGVGVLVADLRLEEYFASAGIHTVNIIDLLYWARREGVLNAEQALDIALSARSIPMILPPTFRSDLG